jgi:hypothetical protein
MADDPAAPNTVSPAVRNRSVVEGDVPDYLRRRYYVDGRGGAGLGFYVDARIAAPAFRDRGRQLVAARSDPNAVRDMTAIAQHRGWTIIVARGDQTFRREVWLSGRTVGIEVRGYQATERDLQELERRVAARERAERGREDRQPQADLTDWDRRDVRSSPAAQSRLRVVETVVRARVADRTAQDRIMAGARTRIADWLERGARFEPLRTPSRSTTVESDQRRERHR